MAKSLYKGERLGKDPPCLICMGPGTGGRAELHLPGGVSVWLCAPHRSVEFQRRRGGRDLVASLMGAWRAAGCMSRRRRRALDAHQARLTTPPGHGRARPGSYAWPELRREAERRAASGQAHGKIVVELRARVASGPARAPARRTILRWLAERRWLALGASPLAGEAARGPPAGQNSSGCPVSGGGTSPRWR